MVLPFGLKNSPAIFSKIVIASFKHFIHKFIKVYFDDYIVYGIVKYHIQSLRMILDRCRQFYISLNLKKCIFCSPFGILLVHAVCWDGIPMDLSKIAIIVNLPRPSTVKQLRTTLGHTGCYRKFIRGYAEVTAPMEKLLKKYVKFQWNEKCQESLDVLKNKMVTAPILVFPSWKK